MGQARPLARWHERASLSYKPPMIPFYKMHGLGNDFVVFDARRSPIVLDETAHAATALLISFGWGAGASMQIASGIIARTRDETSTTS